MRKSLTAVLFVIASPVLLLSLWGCTGTRVGVRTSPEPGYRVQQPESGPPPHAPAVGYRKKHHYWYYPSSYVYYDSGRNMYFYLENNEWRMEARLPSSIRLQIGEAVSLDLDSDIPYVDFQKHKSDYPPGKIKKGKIKAKGKKKK